MRVISGKYKGKKLISPEGDDVRPTSDRIKETIFNILCSRCSIPGAKVLDLFCGSGALGIEALSRGAKEVVFADADIRSVRLAKENLKKIGAPSDSVFNAEFELALKKLKDGEFDVILADPPYKEKYEAKIMSLIAKNNVLKTGGVVMIEHASTNMLPDFEGFDCDRRKCGNTSLSFYTLKA